MTLREHYKKLRKLQRPPHPAKAFIEEISRMTGRSQKTICQWLCGSQHPPKMICSQLGEYLGVPPEELFPESYKNNED